MVGAGICGADIRVVRGDKVATGDAHRPVRLGHEGIGIIEQIGAGATHLMIGDHVVVLPHYFPADHATYCASSTVVPECIGQSHTRHSGWDVDGVWGDMVIAPCTHLVQVDPAFVRQAEASAPHLGVALFAWTEPMLCVLSAYELMARQLTLLQRPPMSGKRALIIGCGPIGILYAVALRKYGFSLCFADQEAARIRLAQDCLEGGVAYQGERDFDLVMVAASSLGAIKMGESVTADGALLYLFAGLNTSERSSTDDSGMLSYERMHRAARAVWTTQSDGRRILYLGHSGYFDHLAPQAVAMVAASGVALGRAVTGVIPGWASPTIEAHADGVSDWTSADGSPALLHVLRGLDLRAGHGKLMITCAGER
ncbi:MAG: alcohol dehydrogenase catalytic domain-containing protein [Ktedonobacterales bacterium]|nr:alcohol dehydrogenase catalytic domain-containing protein [Ktedonobacterales bacterium]